MPYPVVPVSGPTPRPGAATGPYGVLGRVLLTLTPLVTVGLLGMIPSLLLAIRRRRAYDILGAVVFAGLFLTFLVCAGVAGSTGDAPTADTVGMVAMVLMWFGAPLHFLAMDLRAVWEAGRPKAPAQAAHYPPPAAPYAHPVPGAAYAPAPAPGYAVPLGVPAPPGAAAPSTPPPAPGYGYPAPAPYPPTRVPTAPPAPATGEELRELGELLRRQAREGGRP
ncbi:hypothetical protein [Kitasatospora sp. NPDC059327]|uniref:hypothetical protein n=1 Tax=Kitasatospora sp. NPDC059327 TaxID=3346803 RepID=UPI00367A0B02